MAKKDKQPHAATIAAAGELGLHRFNGKSKTVRSVELWNDEAGSVWTVVVLEDKADGCFYVKKLMHAGSATVVTREVAGAKCLVSL